MAKAGKSNEIRHQNRTDATWMTGRYAGYQEWTLNQWAWEFLRRNEDYGEDFRETGDEKKKVRDAQDKWGLKVLKAPSEDYGTGIVPSFKLRFRSFSYDFDQNDAVKGKGDDIMKKKQWPKMSLLPGEIAITIQTKLDIPLQIERVRARIIKRQKEWLTAGLIELLKVKNVVAPINLVEQLKVFDDTRNGKPAAKIAEDVFWYIRGKPKAVAGLSKTNDGSKNAPTSHVKTALIRAQDLVQDGYMLFGLKHRTDKAKSRLRKVKKSRQKEAA